ncbi:hypothetical protein ACJJTC_015018 [Scirpophaga incertulas]
MKLSRKQNQILGNCAFGSATAGQNNVHVHRRERNPNARGACYTVNGAVPAGWIPHINNNFNMIAPFIPTIGVNNPALRVVKNDICNPLSITKRGKRISGIQPNIIEARFNVKTEKLTDVKKLLEKHYGEAWSDLPDLQYYKTVLAHNEKMILSTLPEEMLDFV